MYTSGCAVEIPTDLDVAEYEEMWFLQTNIDDFIPEYLELDVEELDKISVLLGD